MENNNFDDKSLLPAKPIKRIPKKKIILLCILVLLVGLIIWDFADPPLWWQFDCHQDKAVILEYVKDTYPDTIVSKGGRFPVPVLAGPPQDSVMFFELDGIDFGISARYGKIAFDGYPAERATAQFDSIIKDNFFDQRNITVTTNYRFSDNYYEIYPYNGILGVDMTFRDQGATPQDIGCLYDFYKHWKSKGSFLEDYQICIYIYENSKQKSRIRYDKSSEFISEDEFYAAFKMTE